MPRSTFTRERVARSTAAGIVLAVGVVLAGCSPTSSDADPTATSLAFAIPITPVSFSPQEVGTGYDPEWMQPVYDSLLRQMPDGSLEPLLAESWSYDESETSLSITLDPDATFSDGTPVDADAVKANLEATRDGSGPLTASLATISDIEIEDAQNLVLRLSAVQPDLLRSLSQSAGMIANPTALGTAELSSAPQGSGAYELDMERTVAGSDYFYTKRDDYWNEDLSVPFEDIEIKVMTDQTAVLNALQSGQIQAAPVEAANLDAAEGAGLDIVEYDAPGLVGLYFWDRDGQINPALGDKRVRQAIAHAIDRDALLDAVRNGRGTVTGQQFRPGWDSYVEGLDGTYDYDPESARALLSDAGFASGFDLQMVRALPESDLIAQYLGDVGIRVTWVESTNPVPEILAGKTAMDLFQLQSSNTWQVLTTIVTPDAGWNVLNSEDPELDALLDEARALPSADRGPVYKEINTWLVENAWFAPMYTLRGSWAVDPDITLDPQQYAVPFIYDFAPAK